MGSAHRKAKIWTAPAKLFILRVAGPNDPVAALVREWPDTMSAEEFEIRSTDVLRLIDQFWSTPIAAGPR